MYMKLNENTSVVADNNNNNNGSAPTTLVAVQDSKVNRQAFKKQKLDKKRSKLIKKLDKVKSKVLRLQEQEQRLSTFLSALSGFSDSGDLGGDLKGIEKERKRECKLRKREGKLKEANAKLNAMGERILSVLQEPSQARSPVVNVDTAPVYPTVPGDVVMQDTATSATITVPVVVEDVNKNVSDKEERRRFKRGHRHHHKDSSSDDEDKKKKKEKKDKKDKKNKDRVEDREEDSKKKEKKEQKAREKAERKETKKVEKEDRQKVKFDDVDLHEMNDLPTFIKTLYLDGNNMMYLTGALRSLSLQRSKRGVEELLTRVAHMFHAKSKLDLTHLVFDDTPTFISERGFEVATARPVFATSDDYLVEKAKMHKQRGDVEACLFLTSDRELRNRIREVGGKVSGPKSWIRLAHRMLADAQVTELDDWLSQLKINTN